MWGGRVEEGAGTGRVGADDIRQGGVIETERGGNVEELPSTATLLPWGMGWGKIDCLSCTVYSTRGRWGGLGALATDRSHRET